MSYNLVVAFSFSIAFAAVIGLIRFKKIDSSYYPFIVLVWVAFLNEILSFILAHTVRNNIPNNNIYVLLEAILIAWQFYNWRLFGNKGWFFGFICLIIIGWFGEVIFISGLNHFIFYCQVLYSFVFVLMSIHVLNGLLIRERRNIFRNPIFLICIAFISYYTMKVLVQTFWEYGLSVSREFRIGILDTLYYLNLISNLIYALAILWMPSKQRFTMPS